MDAAQELDRLARDQHGVVAWDQLRSLKIPQRWIDHQVATGRLIKMGPAVYRGWGARRSWEARAMAAVLSARAPALVSHRSAAHLYGLDGCGPTGFIDITVPHHRRPKRRAGVTAHESRIFNAVHQRQECRHLIPVTGIAQTLFDCCAPLSRERDRLRLVDDARRLKLVEWEQLWECLLLNAVRGRTGVVAFRELLERRDGEEPPHGVIVRLATSLLEDSGCPGPEFEYPVLGYSIDAAWPDRRVGLECLGKIGHFNEGSFERDPVRRNQIVNEGWKIYEVTWRRLVEDPGGFVEELRQPLCG